MSKFAVPSAPHLEVKEREARADQKPGEVRASASKTQSPLDAAFLGRIYRSMAWFGVVVAVLAAFATKNAASVSSIVAGLILAATLLRAQEIGVRALMRPATQMGGMDARLFLVLLLPLKFVLIVGMLAALNYFGLIQPATLTLGFFAGQVVIVGKVAGWMLVRATQK